MFAKISLAQGLRAPAAGRRSGVRVSHRIQHLQRTRLGRMSNSVLSLPAAQDGVREQYTGTSDVGANLRNKSRQGRVSGVIPIRRKATGRWDASGCKLLYGAVVQFGQNTGLSRRGSRVRAPSAPQNWSIGVKGLCSLTVYQGMSVRVRHGPQKSVVRYHRAPTA